MQWPRESFLRLPEVAASALRLLREHPSLLALPLAIAAFNIFGSQVYASWYRLAFYGQLASYEPQTPLVLWSDLFRYDFGAQTLYRAVPGTSLLLVWQAAGNLLGYRPGAELSYLVSSLLFRVGGRLLEVVSTAFLLGGYYGVVGEVGSSGVLPSGRFAYHAKRNFLRFLGYGVLLWVGMDSIPDMLGTTPLLALWSRTTAHVLDRLLLRAMVPWGVFVEVLSVPLVFTLYAIAVDDLPFGAAVARSVRSVVRQLPVVLAVGICVSIAVSLALLPAMAFGRSDLTDKYVIGSSAFQLLNVLTSALHEVIPAVVGAWINLFLCIWYVRTRVTQSAEPVG